VLCEQTLAFEFDFGAASDQRFAEPHDVVLSPDERFLCVADNNNDRSAVLDPNTQKLLGTFGEGEIEARHDVDFDDTGRLYVADKYNN
jgi:DNA-binding beta-propeller fold protein YncE